jgi:hypothetical protein
MGKILILLFLVVSLQVLVPMMVGHWRRRKKRKEFGFFLLQILLKVESAAPLSGLDSTVAGKGFS